MWKEEEHLTTTFKRNGYPLPFIRSISSTQETSTSLTEDEPEHQEQEEKQPLAVIP